MVRRAYRPVQSTLDVAGQGTCISAELFVQSYIQMIFYHS